MIKCKYGIIGPEEITLSAKACENLDNIALSGVTKWMLEVSQDPVTVNACCSGLPDFESFADFMAYKHRIIS